MSEITSTCPSCGTVAARQPYDIGSGPELSCATCEWCWGADGQDLKPLDPTDLVEHMVARQLKPQLVAEEMRERGLDVDVAFVNTGASAQGYEVTCAKCGRTAKVPFEIPEGKLAVCPDCLRL